MFELKHEIRRELTIAVQNAIAENRLDELTLMRGQASTSPQVVAMGLLLFHGVETDPDSMKDQWVRLLHVEFDGWLWKVLISEVTGKLLLASKYDIVDLERGARHYGMKIRWMGGR